MYKKIGTILILSIVFLSFERGNAVNSNSKNEKHVIKVERLDSLQYNREKNKTTPSVNNLRKITSYKEAKKLLTGIVVFDERDIDYPHVKKINYRNGKQPLQDEYELDDCSFVAYFPDEDILLCEGGHTIDVSFNLKNGKQTEETGNPDLFNYSPQRTFRLNGYFGGQECYSYFIQKKIKDGYETIIQLDNEFERLTKHWLCTIGESFWVDENTLYLTETDFVETGEQKLYFSIRIIEK